jgi:hypothetical protein
VQIDPLRRRTMLAASALPQCGLAPFAEIAAAIRLPHTARRL